jgi:hypothetical protein
MAKIQCKAKTSTGAECRAPAGANGLCFLHAHPEKARTLGQIGGRKNRAQMLEPPPAGSLSAADLRDILVEAIHDVRSKKISPRTAGALAQLCNSAHRILPTADLEARLATLEQQLAEQQSRTFVDGDAAVTRSEEEGCGGTDDQTSDVDTRKSGGAEGRNDGSGEDKKA